MELQTIKQYADEHHVSYEAVRRQVVAYAEELKGHIVTQNGTKYLDEEAVKFLTERRRKSIVVVRAEDQTEELEQLRAEVKRLQEQLASAQTEILKSKQHIIDLQEAQTPLIEAKARYELQTEQLTETKAELRETKKALDDLRTDDAKIISDLMKARDAAQAEADSYTRSWFGFYRKR